MNINQVLQQGFYYKNPYAVQEKKIKLKGGMYNDLQENVWNTDLERKGPIQ
jgi:hypothetical protein